MTVRVTQRSNQIQVSKTEQQLVTAVTKGPRGLQGEVGPRGPGFVAGSGAPDGNDGVDGDTYLDTDTGELYGPKSNGLWPPSSSALSILSKRYTHNQTVASSLWTIDHALGGQPVVTVVDSAGSVVFGDVSYIDDSQIVVAFSAPFAGYAYLT